MDFTTRSQFRKKMLMFWVCDFSAHETRRLMWWNKGNFDKEILMLLEHKQRSILKVKWIVWVFAHQISNIEHFICLFRLHTTSKEIEWKIANRLTFCDDDKTIAARPTKHFIFHLDSLLKDQLLPTFTNMIDSTMQLIWSACDICW